MAGASSLNLVNFSSFGGFKFLKFMKDKNPVARSMNNYWSPTAHDPCMDVRTFPPVTLRVSRGNLGSNVNKFVTCDCKQCKSIVTIF